LTCDLKPIPSIPAFLPQQSGRCQIFPLYLNFKLLAQHLLSSACQEWLTAHFFVIKLTLHPLGGLRLHMHVRLHMIVHIRVCVFACLTGVLSPKTLRQKLISTMMDIIHVCTRPLLDSFLAKFSTHHIQLNPSLYYNHALLHIWATSICSEMASRDGVPRWRPFSLCFTQNYPQSGHQLSPLSTSKAQEMYSD
jgi:hypothetical protein